jgi:hypothetical protein
MSNYPRKTKHFSAFLEDCNPYLLLIYYWGMSLDTVKYQETQSYSFDGTSP